MRRLALEGFDDTTKVPAVDFNKTEVYQLLQVPPKPVCVLRFAHSAIIVDVAREAGVDFRVLIAMNPIGLTNKLPI